MHRQVTRWVGAAALLVAAGAAVSAADAQSSIAAGTRWQAWVGCWTAAPAAETLLMSNSVPMVCVTPAGNGDAVNVATIASGKVVSTQRIDASGAEQPLDAKGCTGTQHAQWSADGRRVFLRTAATCNGVKRTTAGILAFTPAGEWLDVQEISADSGTAVRVARYRDVGVPSTVPVEIAAALSGRSMAVQAARVAAGAPIGTNAVIEASRVSTPAAAEAFILERGERFALDAHDLVLLSDAGVPGRVTDAMVAVSNPQAFAVAHRDGRGSAIVTPDSGEVPPNRRIPVYMEPTYGYYYPYGYGYSPYYGYYNGYGYGYGYPGYYYGSPVIVVNGATGTPQGKMVKGRGYTPATPGTTGAPAAPRAPSGSSSAGSGSASRSSDGGAARTARPRP